MHSPAAEWTLMGAHMTALNLLRNHGDPDRDTISELTRATFRVDTTLGTAAFTAATAAGAALWWWHIVRPGHAESAL